jgi:RimJ/RimL family protein N-acetyltransferase
VRAGAEYRLVTARLELRPVTSADGAQLLSLFTEADVRRHLFDDMVIDDVEADNIVRQSLRAFHGRKFGLWRAGSLADGAFVGCCGLREVGTEAELIVAIQPAMHRRGYAREASTAVLDYALRRAGLPRVIGACDLANDASRALCRELGMREQHVTRVSGLAGPVDVVVHEIVAADLVAARVRAAAAGGGP